MRETLSLLLDSTLRSYAVIFFSQKKIFGFLLLGATFVEPVKGLFGLLGLLTSNGLAYVLGFERGSLRKGYFGFNALLLGLALSHFYAPSWKLALLIFISALLAAVIAAALQNVFWRFFGLPSLSLPFVMTFSMVFAATAGLGKLPLAGAPAAAALAVPGHPFLEVLLKSVGPAFFQVNIVSGAVVVLAMLVFSRLGFLLGLAGLASGYLTHLLLGASLQVLTEQYLGFNYFLIGIALGGIFLVPSLGTLILVVLSSSAAALFTLSAGILLPGHLPPTAIPFNVVTLLVLYALKLRLFPSDILALSTAEVSSPEENLAAHRANLKSFRRYGVELSLPFHGSWRVQQGFNGKLTHREDWRFGVDFVVADASGKFFDLSGSNLKDYFCFDLPVLAPAEGKIVFIRSDVPDNPAGKTNERDNWGNAVILEHAPEFYSCLAHLREGSVKAAVGETVKRGQEIARCGNSGRSPYPHLHFQMQAVPVLGAPTRRFRFANFLEARAAEKSFQFRREAAEGEIVSNLAPAPDDDDLFPCSFTQDLVYEVQNGEAEPGRETWSMETDLYGNLILVSRPVETRLSFTPANGVLSVKKLEGSRKTGLYAWGELLPDLPLVTDGKLAWRTEEETDFALPRAAAFFLDLLSIFGVRFRFELENVLSSNRTSLTLVSTATLKVKTPLGAFYLNRRMRTFTHHFLKKTGLVGFREDGFELRFLETRPREEKP